ncbi:MAG TPA: hypothetical protein VKZ53_08700 [Candidatus Angelobacter sp.]|nr:hypothetical protein [Candidatus Angelobacter sp.]
MHEESHHSEPSNGSHALPLFRPQAIAALEHKSTGEILLIRPFSLLFLGWLAIAVVGAVFAFLLLGRYTPKARVSGILLDPSSAGITARLDVPQALIGYVRIGESLVIQCGDCTESTEQTQWEADGVVTEIQTQAENSSAKPAASRTKVATVAKVATVENKIREGGMSESPIQTCAIGQTCEMIVTISFNFSNSANSFNSADGVRESWNRLSTGRKIVASVPLDRKPLLQWIFARSGA